MSFLFFSNFLLFFLKFSLHLVTSDPSNDEHVTWEDWYLLDSSITRYDESATNQLYDTKTTYWMTGTIYKKKLKKNYYF